MSKYQPLSDFLFQTNNSTLTLTFDTIETILGFKLPESAYLYRPWWANSKAGHSQSQSWVGLGWETSDVNLDDKTVTFNKTFDITEITKNVKPAKNSSFDAIEKAKNYLASHFDVEAEDIQITINY